MSVSDDFLALVPRLRCWAQANPEVRRLWIYGSRLRGTQRDDSDLDVAFEFDPLGSDDDPDLMWMDRKRKWQSELQALTAWELQLEWYGGDATPEVSRYLACCSMLVYEKRI